MTDMRQEFGKLLTEKAHTDKDIVVLIGDIGYGVYDDYKEIFPDRLYNLGIAEQSMVGVAAGMALEGLKPYVYSITPFLIERPFEQIKLDIDQQNVNVTLIGYADFENMGPTHAELDSEYMMKMFKNIKSYFPETLEELKKAFEESYEYCGPSFIRLKRI